MKNKTRKGIGDEEYDWVSIYLNFEQDVAHDVEIARFKFERMQERQKNKMEGEM
ncbi:hypothetical protein AB6A23_03895 [Paenibacillus tarimensis]